VGRTIVKGSNDQLRILVVEGPSNRHSSTNKPLGVLLITGKQIARDLMKGTEVDLRVSMSESRDLTVNAFLNGTDQEFSQVFAPKFRHVTTADLAAETLHLESKLQTELDDAEKNGQRDVAAGLEKTLSTVQTLMGEIAELKDDDVTDKKYQLEDRKREAARAMFDLTSGKRLEQARRDYQDAKSECAKAVQETGNDRERNQLKDVLNREQTFINSNVPDKIQAETEALRSLMFGILARTPTFLRGMLEHLNQRRAAMNDQVQATRLLEAGKRAVASDDWEEVRTICGRLWDLMPEEQQTKEEMRMFTGLV
jgi:molecular chaperone DnaK